MDDCSWILLIISLHKVYQRIEKNINGKGFFRQTIDLILKQDTSFKVYPLSLSLTHSVCFILPLPIGSNEAVFTHETTRIIHKWLIRTHTQRQKKRARQSKKINKMHVSYSWFTLATKRTEQVQILTFAV